MHYPIIIIPVSLILIFITVELFKEIGDKNKYVVDRIIEENILPNKTIIKNDCTRNMLNVLRGEIKNEYKNIRDLSNGGKINLQSIQYIDD